MIFGCLSCADDCTALLVCLVVLQLDPTATPIHEVEDIASLTADTSTTGTQWGTGGMVTKLTAARIATGERRVHLDFARLLNISLN